jgi:hypothetical protein
VGACVIGGLVGVCVEEFEAQARSNKLKFSSYLI